jgi:EAL domain-containing protein (putative c-di-GMP-specific phosphodiesterase class I)
MMIDPKDMIIVKTIINLAKELEIQTVAEGVEDEAQVAILKALGCDYIQGYYFYKPMPKEEFLNLLKLL